MAGIYIHIPFCKQACYYCDFHFSVSIRNKKELIKALSKEMSLRKSEITEPIETIYFGGGTPSLLTIEELRFLIEEVYKNYQVVLNPEITLEANPDDLTIQQINDLTETKINRLSIGVQSFFEEDLQLMNRAHNATEAKKCIQEATKHFNNITIDLIYGIPGMSDERWKENLQIALGFGVPHISSYALTVEPKTALEKFIKTGKIPPVEETISHNHYLILLEEMEKAGFVNYEFSNFGKEGYFSKNNTAYWQGKSYLGIGPSAHSYDGKIRSWNVRNNGKYIKSIIENELPIERETLTISNQYNEYIMTGLRTMWGVSFEKIENDFGEKYVDYLLKQSKKPLQEGLLKLVFARSEESPDCYRATKKPYQIKRSSSNNEITSSLLKKEVSPKDGILKITKKGKFLSDGIASNLFYLE